jgi:hypothetical protein
MVRILKVFPQFLRGLADVGRLPDFCYATAKIYKSKFPTAARCYKRSGEIAIKQNSIDLICSLVKTTVYKNSA